MCDKLVNFSCFSFPIFVENDLWVTRIMYTWIQRPPIFLSANNILVPTNWHYSRLNASIKTYSVSSVVAKDLLVKNVERLNVVTQNRKLKALNHKFDGHESFTRSEVTSK